MANYSIFADRLKRTRLDLNIKQNELAEKSGISATTISAYENGLKIPSLENAVKLATTLGVSLDWLCGIDNQATSQNKNESFEIIKALMFFMKKFDYDMGITTKGGKTLNYIRFYYNELFVVQNVINEYNLIAELTKSSKIVTNEMIQTLENALIDKYKNVNLLEYEDDLPF